ncbi:MAG TPA: PP2C family protein-serine/threonine phosphatase, partial [Thermoanaerobaculia bacterium]|nr:PP2C family protein-serine/threonine phosphatase [Thermoanaerobaculia bacterium]
EQTYLFMADVSGHGLPAAILVSLLKSYIHTESAADRPLNDFMARLNNFLFSVSLPTQFATAQLFQINERGQLTYANAAHPPFLLYRRNEKRTTIVELPSNLLGAMPNMTFEEQTIDVAPGDTLFAYTDGLTDRADTDGQFYSIDRIAALLESSGDAALDCVYDAINDDIRNFSATEEFKDDIAFVVTRFH